MASAATHSASLHDFTHTRLRSPSPSTSAPLPRSRHSHSTSPRLSRSPVASSSTSPPPAAAVTSRSSPRPSTRQAPEFKRQSTEASKVDHPNQMDYEKYGEDVADGLGNGMAKTLKMDGHANGKANATSPDGLSGRAGTSRNDGSLEPEDEGLRNRIAPSTPKRLSKRSTPSSPYNGLPTLPTILGEELSEAPLQIPASPGRGPPPAPSAAIAANPSSVRPVTRTRRSSSIKRKPSPGVTPQKAVDWEIPRKTLHSSIGFLTLFLYYMDPPTVRPLISLLSAALVTILAADYFRLNFPAFAEVWEANFGILMRESERDKINGVVWYLIGVIFVLGVYPRDVAVVSILTLSWSDTTASTIGRLWGKHTPPLPAHLPLIPAIKFAPRKSLAGFLAATMTGFFITLVFWHNGCTRWAILGDSAGKLGLLVTSAVFGVGGAVVEALDLGLDDNLTLPILSGAIMWTWLGVTNVLAGRW